MVFPWIPFLSGGKKRLSDIEFLAIKEFDGKLKQSDGSIFATGDVATITASSGKDMYLARAKITISSTSTAGTSSTVVLKVNGTVVGTTVARLDDTSNGTYVYEFASSGLKVAATEIIKIEVTIYGTNQTISGELICFEETTGESPQIT